MAKFHKYRVIDQGFMINAVTLIDCGKVMNNEVVKLYKYETGEEIFLTCVEYTNGNKKFEVITEKSHFKLMQSLKYIPKYEVFSKTSVKNSGYLK